MRSNYQNIMEGRGMEFFGVDKDSLNSLHRNHHSPQIGPLTSRDVYSGMDGEFPSDSNKKTSHKAAEQKRRDSLKNCFEDLRKILPPVQILFPDFEDGPKRPGEGNVGGSRSGNVDPQNPNKGVSKVALLRRSNEYILILHSRLERRERAIQVLRNRILELRDVYPEEELLKDLDGFEFGDLDRIERTERGRSRMYAMEEDEGEADEDVDMELEEEEERNRKEKEKRGKKISNDGGGRVKN
jgi:hypothetical protein